MVAPEQPRRTQLNVAKRHYGRSAASPRDRHGPRRRLDSQLSRRGRPSARAVALRPGEGHTDAAHVNTEQTPSSKWPFVGRQQEFRRVRAFVDRPSPGGLIVAGVSGVGKTRLVKEAVAVDAARNERVVWISGTVAAQPIPFGAFAHVLPAGLGPSPSVPNLVRAAADQVLAGSDRRPVVVIDDAHALDGHSAALVHHLALSGRCAMVITVRSGETAPDAVTALWKDEICERHEIQPLDRPEADELLDRVLRAPVDGATRHRLWEAARGNLMFLHELVVGGHESGALVLRDGLWRWQGRLPALPRMAEAVRARLEQLDRPAREALELATVGQPVDVEVLHRLAGQEAIVSLERAGLLHESREGLRTMARLAHPVYADLLSAEMPPARQRLVAERLADAYSDIAAASLTDMFRIASWRLASGGSLDPEVAVPAAQEALALCDFPLAERLARCALDRGESREAARGILVSAVVGQGRFEGAEQILANLEDAADSDASRAFAVLTRAHNLSWNLRRPDEAVALLTAAEAEISDEGARAEVTACRAHLTVTTDAHRDVAIRLGRSLLDGEGASSQAVFYALGAAGMGLIAAGRPEEATRLLEEHLDSARSALQASPFAPIGLTGYRFFSLHMAGDFVEAAALVDSAYDRAVALDAAWVRGTFACMAGTAARSRGRLAEASRRLREGTALLREEDVMGQLWLFLGELAYVCALTGDRDGAAAALSESRSARGPDMAFPYPAQAEVWYLAACGEVSRAVSVARAEADRLARRGAHGGEAWLLHEAVRLDHADCVRHRLGELAHSCDGRLIPTFASHAAALAGDDTKGLEAASVTFEHLGADLLAAEAAAQAAHVHRARGERGHAHQAAARACFLAERCEDARTPALTASEQTLPLTRREHEVALLAAHGLSNQDIAERLVVSCRTVENHLHRVYEKLGLAGRQNLVGILAPATRTGVHRPSEN